MNKILKYYLLFFFLAPFFSFVFVENIGYSAWHGIYYYWIISTIFGSIYLTFIKIVAFPKYLIPLLIYIVYVFIWSIINGNLERRGFIANYLINSMHPAFIFLLIIENVKFTNKFIVNSIKYIKLTMVVAFAFTIIQLIIDPSFFSASQLSTDNQEVFSKYLIRRGSIYGYLDPNGIGLTFLPLVSILVGYNVLNKKSTFGWLIIAGIVAIATNSRYVIISFILIILQYLFVQDSKTLRFKRILIISASVLIVIMVFYYVGYNFEEFYSKRLFAEGAIENTTRYLAYETFLYFFPKTIYFGTGEHLTARIAESLAGRSSQIHIGYLSHLVTYGIVGSSLLFTFWFLLARRLFQVAKKTKYYGSIFAFLIFLWANFTLVYYSVFTYGLVFAFIFSKYYSDINNSSDYN